MNATVRNAKLLLLAAIAVVFLAVPQAGGQEKPNKQKSNPQHETNPKNTQLIENRAG